MYEKEAGKLVFGASLLLALGSGPLAGATTCASCGVPPELEARAAALEKSFSTVSDEFLARQRWAGTMCEYHPCAGEVTEDQAKDLLDSYMARKAKRTDAYVAWGGLLVAVFGSVLAILGLRQSARNERDIGELRAGEDRGNEG